jgi:hypothetical protein
MGDTMRAWGIAVALLLALPISAQAQSVQDVFRSFGLIGVWASACNQPPDIESGNPQAIYARSSSDAVMLTYDYGARHRAAVYTIVSAQPAARDQVSYVEERLHDKARLTVTVLKARDQISVVSAVGPDGRAFVENGRIVATGQPTPQQVRCQ